MPSEPVHRMRLASHWFLSDCCWDVFFCVFLFVYLFYMKSSSDSTYVILMKTSHLYMTFKVILQNSFILNIQSKYEKRIMSHNFQNSFAAHYNNSSTKTEPFHNYTYYNTAISILLSISLNSYILFDNCIVLSSLSQWFNVVMVRITLTCTHYARDRRCK